MEEAQMTAHFLVDEDDDDNDNNDEDDNDVEHDD